MSFTGPRPTGTVWEMTRETFIENWPRDLRLLSIPSAGARLSIAGAATLGRNMIGLDESWIELEPSRPSLGEIEEKLERAFEIVRNPGFVRTGGAAPMDTPKWAVRGPRVRNAEEALAMLCDGSRRINFDLHQAVAMEYLPWLWVREWHDVPGHEEFRVFIHRGRMVGLCQRWTQHALADIFVFAEEIKRVIGNFVEWELAPALHVPNAVVDVACHRDARWLIVVIDVNPFWFGTDPVLFDWRRSDGFDGSMRFIGESGKVERV